MTNHPIPQIQRENILKRVDEIMKNTDLVQDFEIRITGGVDRTLEVEYDITEGIPTWEVNNDD